MLPKKLGKNIQFPSSVLKSITETTVVDKFTKFLAKTEENLVYNITKM